MIDTNVSYMDVNGRIKMLAEEFKYMIANEEFCPKGLKKNTENTKNVLNKIYPKFKCVEVMYTFNTDKEFFGCRIYPYNREINSGNIADCLMGSCENVDPTDFKSFTHYQIELDFKLFNSIAGLNCDEIATLIIHDIDMYAAYHFNTFSMHFENCLMNMDMCLCKKSVKKCPELFIFVMNECMRYMLSVFTSVPYNSLINIEEADNYPYLKDALYKVIRAFPETNAEGIIDYKNYSIKNACILMEWYLNIYTSLDTDRYPLVLLKKSIDYSGSELFKNKVKQVIRSLESNYWNNTDMGEPVAESTKPGFFAKLKLDGLKSIEEDLYEYKMRIRNVETQDDAILLMRQINNRMGILDEFLMEHQELSEKDRAHWEDVFNKYNALREELSNKAVYNRKMYGLFVDYNALQQMSDSNQMLNTYY